MSIEENISTMVKLLAQMNDKMDQLIERGVDEVVNASAGIQAPGPAVEPAPVPAPAAPVVVPPAPAPVSQTEPAPVVASTCPITDQKSLIDYVMGAYQELGPEHGAGIQQVMAGLGIQNINDTTPEQYQPLYDGVQKLRG